MKIIAVLLALSGMSLSLSSQVISGNASLDTASKDSVRYQIVERGPSHRVLERTTFEPNMLGEPTARKHRVVELATGMHYLENGQWKESREVIEAYPGGAIARQGPRKVIFANNLATADAIDTEVNGERLSCHPLMLAYFDAASGKIVPLAEVKDCQGKVAGNQVWYEDACEGLKCTIRYTYSRGGLEQDVIMLEQPPAPEAFGLASATTRLQMMTEFVTPLPVRKEPRALEVKGVGTLADEFVWVGSTRFGRSQAFMLGAQKGRWQGVPAARQWIAVEGRQLLIEEVPVPAVQAEWRKLPKGQGASLNTATNRIGWLVSTKQILPAPREKQADTRRMEVAAVTPRPSGWVLDWQQLGEVDVVDVTNLTFQTDTTYLITGPLFLHGTTTIEGGTVIKFSSSNAPLVYVMEDLKCETSPYRPAVLTSENDNTVGETIDCSTGSPAVNEAIYLALETAPRVQGLRFAYAYDGLVNVSSAVEVWDCQFLYCSTAMWAWAPIKLRNLLVAHCNLGVDYGWMIFGEHLTVDDCGLFAAVYGGCITNSLFTGVSTLGNVTLDHCVQAASGTGIYQSVGGGAYYLSLDSTNRNAGNTNINSELAAALRTKTTYPPLAYTNTTLPGYDTFYPMAQRDTDVPDLGYHYDPLDYLVGGVDVNVNTTFAPGTAVGWFRYNQGWYHAGHGLHIADTNTLAFDGQAEQPCYFVHQTAVQEDLIGYTTMDAGPGGITGWATTKANRPYLNLRFTRCAGLPIYRNHFRDDWGGLYVSANHCEFYGGGLGGYVSDLGLTNCLLDRTGVWLEAGNTNYAEVVALRNCTARGGTLSINRQYDTAGHIRTAILDCAFESTTFSTSDPNAGNASLTRYDYNAYLTNASRAYPNGEHDVLVNTFNWQSGWLGNFYLPTNSSLINTGSVTDAASVGLYHFTTVTNQVKETNSIVDIGYHYVALDTNNVPVDTDSGGVADYLEDPNGSGTVNGDETDWTSGHGGDDKDHKVNKHLLTPGYLRCEYRVDPWGVDAKDPWTQQQRPRLYWIVTSQRRMAKQVAYRILVASSPENLNANYGDMWDSGRVCSDQTIHVEYNGATLQSGQRLWWKVKTLELFSGKASPWSTNAFFQMGLLNANDWSGAKWIGVNNYSGVCPMFRREFALTNQIQSATVYASAKGVYDLWINGRKIGPNVLAPEWTDYRKRIQYQTFDVTTNLLSGTPTYPSNNVLGAVVGEGWFSDEYPGHVNYAPINPQFLLCLVITNSDGSRTIIASGDDWTSFTDGTIQSASILNGEQINANKVGFTSEWSTPSYSQANLFTTDHTVTNTLDTSLLVSQPNDPIQITQFISPINVWTTAISADSVTKVFDMGQNMVGWCKLTVANTNGVSATNWDVRLKHAEVLALGLTLGYNNDAPNGPSTMAVYTENLKDAIQEDVFTLNGESIQVFQPHFTYHGFRFVRVTAPPTIASKLSADSLVGCVIHSGVPFTGAFACYGTNAVDNNAKAVLSKNLVNKLMTNAFWGLRGNLQGVFTACTQRYERQGYFYDEHIFSQTACYFADMSGFLYKFVRDIRDNQASNGRYSVYAPFGNFDLIDPPKGEDPGPETGGLIFPWRMYQNYADTRILREHYSSATNWMKYATNTFPRFYWENYDPAEKVANGLPQGSQFNVADWMHSYHTIDPGLGSPHPDGYAPTTTKNYSGLEGTNWGTAWYAYSADTVASMSRVLQLEAAAKGDSASASFFYGHSTNYTDLATKVRKAYTNSTPLQWIKFDHNSKITNVFYNTQADCIMALYFDMLPQNQRSNVLDILLNAPYGINYFNTTISVVPRLSTGYFCSSRGMLELTRDGYTRLAYKLLLDARFPSWVYPADNGFTTCWEGWNTYVGGAGTDRGYYTEQANTLCSFNHLTFGAVGEWIWQVIGGINPDDDNSGFANVIIRPEPGGGVTNSFASFNSIHGEIRSIWTNDVSANTYVLNVTVPANTTATIFMPTTNNPAGFTENGLGTVLGASNAPGILTNYTTAVLGWTNGASVFRIGSGTYRFAIKNVVLQ